MSRQFVIVLHEHFSLKAVFGTISNTDHCSSSATRRTDLYSLTPLVRREITHKLSGPESIKKLATENAKETAVASRLTSRPKKSLCRAGQFVVNNRCYSLCLSKMQRRLSIGDSSPTAVHPSLRGTQRSELHNEMLFRSWKILIIFRICL